LYIDVHYKDIGVDPRAGQQREMHMGGWTNHELKDISVM